MIYLAAAIVLLFLLLSMIVIKGLANNSTKVIQSNVFGGKDQP
jgi:hypothetical protein